MWIKVWTSWGARLPICLHFCLHSESFFHTTSWKWLHQSQEFLLQKGVNNALYWQKICGRDDSMIPRLFPSWRIYEALQWRRSCQRKSSRTIRLISFPILSKDPAEIHIRYWQRSQDYLFTP